MTDKEALIKTDIKVHKQSKGQGLIFQEISSVTMCRQVVKKSIWSDTALSEAAFSDE